MVEPKFMDELPYTIAYVDLEEGIRMMTRIVDCKPEDIQFRHGRRSRYSMNVMDIFCPTSVLPAKSKGDDLCQNIQPSFMKSKDLYATLL